MNFLLRVSIAYTLQTCKHHEKLIEASTSAKSTYDLHKTFYNLSCKLPTNF